MLKIFSYGGGVQSTAALVLAAQGKIDYKTFLFCNVGDDSEHPDTIKYVHDVAMPYAKEHGIELIELHKVLRSGEIDTLYGRLTRPNSRSIGIPVRMSNGAPGNRACTADFKIKVVDRWLREHGAKKSHAIVGLGISLDEFQRVKENCDPNTMEWKQNAFPLLFDLPKAVTRQDCMNIIAQAGLSVPPKSSCYFCPFHRLPVWQKMRHDEPELFEKASQLETMINERRAKLGKDQVWLTNKLIPLAKATSETEQLALFDEAECDSGYCFL